MFKFFTQKQWFLWSIFGSIFILVSTWYQVQLDVKINEWFGEFYDTLQKALTTQILSPKQNLLDTYLHLLKLQHYGLSLLYSLVFLQVIGCLDGEHQWQIITMNNG